MCSSRVCVILLVLEICTLYNPWQKDYAFDEMISTGGALALLCFSCGTSPLRVPYNFIP